MVQTLPQVQVFQEFTLAPIAIQQPLRAFIFGPHYQVRTYEKTKSLIGLGAYDPDADQEYLWPALQPGEVVDQSFTRVFVDDARIRYLEAASGGPGYNPTAPNELVLGGSLGWTTTTAAARLGSLIKDVAVGDQVYISAPLDGSINHLSEVRAIRRAVVPSSLPASPTAETQNSPAAGSPGTAAQVSEPAVPGDLVLTVDATNYAGFIHGLLTERYTFRVSVGGAIGVARVDLISDSGFDDAFNVLISAAPAAIGDLGLLFSFAGVDAFTLGEEWVVDVQSAFPAATSAADVNITGTFTGPQNTTYIMEIVEGGIVGTHTPSFRLTTNNGLDSANPTAATNAPVAVGAYGISLSVDTGTRLFKGDRFVFVATAQAEGRSSRLVLANTIPSALTSLSDVNIQLFAIRDIELTSIRANVPGATNWEQDTNTVNLKLGATYFSAGDVLSGLEVRGGQLYAGYRALSAEFTNTIQSIDDVGQLNTYFDDLTPENPLGFAVKAALANANGVAVRFVGVTSDTLAGYINALGKTLERRDLYSFVPLTEDRAVKNTVAAHVTQQSSPEKGRWRIAWLTSPVRSLLDLVGTEALVEATVAQDALDPVDVFRLMTSATADFITSGVLAGDMVRYNYTVDELGEAVYETAVIQTVISEEQVLLVAGPPAAINTAVKIEVWRALNADGQVVNLVEDNTYASRRVYNVLAGGATMDGFEAVPDYFVAAAYAGLRSGVLPHQGLTNVQIAGIEAVPYTSDQLTADHLNSLMNAGFWLVVRDVEGGEIYCRKQLSTDLTDLNSSEQSVTTNIDSQSYVYLATLAPYIGRTNNVANATRRLIRADLEAVFQTFINNATPTLGSQVLDGTTIRSLRPHATLPDRLVIIIDTVIPYALNNIDNYIVI